MRQPIRLTSVNNAVAALKERWGSVNGYLEAELDERAVSAAPCGNSS